MLTDAKIKAAMKTVETETTLSDKSEGRGAGSLLLVVRRQKSGAVTAQWFAQVKRDGRRTKKEMGRYPEVTLADARGKMREQVSPTLLAGKSLRVVKEGDLPTVENLFKGYVAKMRKEGKGSAYEVERVLLLAKYNAADTIGRHREAADVDEHDVVTFVSRFFKRGHRSAADKARSYIGSAYTWAMRSANDYTDANRQDWGIKQHPVKEIPVDSGANNTRERNLSTSEMKALWLAADEGAKDFSLETAACVRLLIACGQRVRETLRMEGAEIDLEGATWNMPTAKTKGKKRPHSIPIPRQALPVLARLKETHGDGPLFPARGKAKALYIHDSSIAQCIERWLAQAGNDIPAFQTRDIRRSWTSRAGETEMDTGIRDLIQQHAQSGTASKHYDRAQYLPKMRKAMDIWEAWLDEMLADKELREDLAA